MTRRVRLRLAARNDVAEEALFLAERSPAAADRFPLAVERAARRLSQFPRLGRRFALPGGPPGGLRSWPVPGFEDVRIWYRSVPDGIDVLRVLHGARDLPGALRQREEE